MKWELKKAASWQLWLVLGALTYALHRDVRSSMVVVTDVNPDRLARAKELFPEEEAKKDGIQLHFVNMNDYEDPVAELLRISGGTGYDDVFCYAPVAAVVSQSSAILGRDGCLNFFAGPTDSKFSASMNFYDVHYNSTHVMGTTGGNTDDMLESLKLTAAGRIDPAVMVTHIGGLDAAAETTLNLPKIPGGKKLIYTHLTMPLTALDELRAKGEEKQEIACHHLDILPVPELFRSPGRFLRPYSRRAGADNIFRKSVHDPNE